MGNRTDRGAQVETGNRLTSFDGSGLGGAGDFAAAGGGSGGMYGPVINEIARRVRPLHDFGECFAAASLAVGSGTSWYRALRPTGAALVAGVRGFVSAREAARYAGRGVVPGSVYRRLTAASDATATAAYATARASARASVSATGGAIVGGVANDRIFGGDGSASSIIFRRFSKCRDSLFLVA